MGLNIKNDETCRLARELARLTGESMTGAITVALRERLSAGAVLRLALEDSVRLPSDVRISWDKNDETCRLARELARLTGESMTGAITVALREPLLYEGDDFTRTDVAAAG